MNKNDVKERIVFLGIKNSDTYTLKYHCIEIYRGITLCWNEKFLENHQIIRNFCSHDVQMLTTESLRPLRYLSFCLKLIENNKYNNELFKILSNEYTSKLFIDGLPNKNKTGAFKK